GLSDARSYVGSVTLNGTPLTHAYVTHEQIQAGGELRFRMQAKPNQQWATDPAQRPYSMSAQLQ
ncbi:glycoside hydrolase domain-containing protein, partial [Xanthomonas perforans]